MSDRAAEFLAEQKRLAEAATEGWHIFETSWDRNALGVENDADEMVFWEVGGGITVAYPHDAEFIAAARSSVPKLIAAVEAVEEALALGDELEKTAPEYIDPTARRLQIANRVLNLIESGIEAALGGEGE